MGGEISECKAKLSIIKGAKFLLTAKRSLQIEIQCKTPETSVATRCRGAT